ncbi:hypothetical protein GVN16_06220 [Emticicia sp. CRIBPO]|uniref:hypothetical protein n=1 Tax=Emticicia sp. CRIBPO TaxID=2683258 RepID=UPI0014134C23|nr:hypothetical protein [Emticicia sp. CRIBPO]NBA85348.1 hypothetical protein [Emticicia sp. CRIBPO]
MKKILFLLMLLGLTSPEVSACDICGCGNGGSFFGILPQSHLRFGGVRYRTKNFDSHLNSEFLRTKENFQTAELWTRFYPLKRTQLMVFVPYSVNAQTIMRTSETIRIHGLGDMSALMHYSILNTFYDTTAHQLDQIWLLGGGIKLPTGKYKFDENGSEVANANFQLGSGSTDFMINSIYTLRKSSYGINMDVTYKINTTNRNDYRFANRLNGSLSFFYTRYFGSLTLMPNAGFYAEHAGYDQKNGTDNTFTGGTMATGNIGMETYYKKFSAGFVYQLPVYQNLSDGDLKLKNSFSVHITRLF